jgi:hypothetical protein
MNENMLIRKKSKDGIIAVNRAGIDALNLIILKQL